MEVGAGNVFQVEQKDFTNALYQILQRVYEQPRHPKNCIRDYIALLRCLDLAFIGKKQLSGEMVNGFVKRLSMLQMHLQSGY